MLMNLEDMVSLLMQHEPEKERKIMVGLVPNGDIIIIAVDFDGKKIEAKIIVF